MDLNVLWFVLIVVLFTGFFFLEGFDYGVGALLPFISKDDKDRRMVLRAIGPVWDGNEVWMLTAGGAVFAAFPHVYATMFSTFYFALFLMLVALILRGVAFEFRDKEACSCWRKTWDGAIFFGSVVPAVLWGVAVTNLIQGLAINGYMHYMGSFFDLLSVYTVVGGLAFLFVFIFHGGAFLTLKLGETYLIQRIRCMALKAGGVAVVFYVLCLLLTAMKTDLFTRPAAVAALVLAAVCFLAANMFMCKGVYKSAFVGSSLAIVFTTVGFFLGLFPRLMVSSLNPEWSLTIYNASSTPYTLNIMTMAAVCLVPVVLLYQIYTYWVFRKRIKVEDMEQEH